MIMLKTIDSIPMGGTDCAIPMGVAWQEKWPIDVFHVYTDSETKVGHMHPHQALQRYRDQLGINAKLAVVAMASNGFTIADPTDAGMLDVVGCDTSTPNVLAEFARM